ncbi:MAG: DUF4332 domain-containing protein [Asgard group archaeon]|nr:DUF4332 domain-containing protein [Asgard group archaeon]
MDEKEYRDYMKKIRKKTPEQIEENVERVLLFEQFLEKNYGKNADDVSLDELIGYIKTFDNKSDEIYKQHHYSIYNYYRCMFNQYLSDELYKFFCERMNQERRIFKIKKFQGIDKNKLKKLNEFGLITIEDIHENTNTNKKREELAYRTNISMDWIMKITKLCDIARIAGLKGTRSVLYYDAGVDTIEKIVTWDPIKLREHFIKFCESTNYQGAKPPTQKECNNHVKIAKQLPKIIEF